MVTTPQEVAAMDVCRAMDLFDQVKIPIIGIVENMSYYQNGDDRVYLFGKGGGDRLALHSGIPLLGQIPIATEISLSGDSGKPLLVPGETNISKSGEEFLKIADGIINEINLMTSESSGIMQQFEIAWRAMST